MATRAQDKRVRQLGRDRHRIQCMLFQGTVAGLAVDSSVLTGLLHVEDIRMAFLARFVSGVTRFSCSDLFQGVTTIKAVFTETLGLKHRSGNEEERKSDDYDRRKPYQVLCVFEFGQGTIPVLTRIFVWGGVGAPISWLQ